MSSRPADASRLYVCTSAKPCTAEQLRALRRIDSTLGALGASTGMMGASLARAQAEELAASHQAAKLPSYAAEMGDSKGAV